MAQPQPLFSHTSDSALLIRGYELRATDRTYADSNRSIFWGLEDASVLASSETRLFTCFRFLPGTAEWGTAWRKERGKECINLDLVFLTDIELPFFGCNLASLSPGLQRLVIGLASRDVFVEVVDNCSGKLSAWGHDPAQIKNSLAHWFERQGYAGIESLFSLFEGDADLSDCEGVIPWLDFDDVVSLYEQFTMRRSDFTTRLDSRFHYENVGTKPKNKTKTS
jgi:hypothetical protein